MLDIENLPENLKIDVDYYDSTEKSKLESYASLELIKDVTGKTIEVPTRDFLTYYIFYKKTPGKPEFSSFDELSYKFSHALTELDGYFNYKDDTLRTNEGENFKNSAISERIGEAIGISVVNTIHGLTRADWSKIDEIRGANSKKTLDYEYEIGSDGKDIIHIENKGSLVEDNTKRSALSDHKRSILTKKEEIRGDSHYPYPSNIMYGTIGAIDSKNNHNAKCWLLDPDPEEVDIDPLKLRILNRYNYLLNIVRMISPRSQLTTALTTRFYDIAAIEDYAALDGLPVRKASGEEFPFYDGEYENSPLYAGYKSYLTHGQSIGGVVAYGRERLLYLGIDMDILNALAFQDFNMLVDYSNKQRANNDIVRCAFSKTQQGKLSHQIDKYFADIQPEIDKSSGYVFYKANANIISFREGLMFAVLDNSE